MASKRTYSRHNMTIAQADLAPSDPEGIYSSTKRRRPTPPSPESSLPRSHVLNGGGRPRSYMQHSATAKVQKGHSKKSFSGPTSFPTDMDLDEPETKTDPFESILAEANTRKAPQPPRGSIYGGGRNFLTSISARFKNRVRAAKKNKVEVYLSDDSSVDGGIQLPLNGAHEANDLGSDEMGLSEAGSDITFIKASMRGGSNLTAAEASARVFEGREYMALRTAPPRRTLWGDRIQADSVLALGWSANQDDSPLLHLPASVRRTIFKYALGGNSIEFGYVTYVVKEMPNGLDQHVPSFRYISNVYDDQRNPFQGIRPRMKVPDATGLTLLNGICRQLYYETYTLPYSLNDFYFNSGNTLFNFLVKEDRLQPQQCNAMKSIVVLRQLPVPAVLDKLPNLEHILLITSKDLEYYKVVKGEKHRELVKDVSIVEANMRGGHDEHDPHPGWGGSGFSFKYSHDPYKNKKWWNR